MAQQMVNGSCRVNGSTTITCRMSKKNAVVGPVFGGLHRKPQDEVSLRRRKLRWMYRNQGRSPREIEALLDLSVGPVQKRK